MLGFGLALGDRDGLSLTLEVVVGVKLLDGGCDGDDEETLLGLAEELGIKVGLDDVNVE